MTRELDLLLDPNDLLGTDLVTESEHETVDALQEVAQRISGHYGDVIASWTAQLFASPRPAEGGPMRGTIANLLRLAQSARNDRQAELLDRLLSILDQLEGTVPRTRQGDSARVALRDWIPEFAQTLTGEDSARLLRLVEWDADTMPLLAELREIRGIGPRRLTRLYSAGLGNLDTVADAAPEDITAVTGIPVAVSEEVVRRARAFAVEERERCVQEIRHRAVRLKMLLTRVGSSHADHALIAAAQAALADVEGAFDQLLGTRNP